MSMNIQEAIIRVRERVHDVNSRAFDDAELLRAFDDAFRDVFTVLRTHGDAHGLDSEDVTISTGLTRLETGVYQYEKPDRMSDIQLIELLQADGSVGAQLVKAPLEHKDAARGIFPGSRPVWHWGPRGSVQIRGTIDGWVKIRVWYVRLLVPLFYGVASGASTTTAIVVATSTGAFKPRDDDYTGLQFEATAGANAGLIRRVTAHVAATLTVVAFPATMASQPFAQVLPLPDEYTNYIVDLVTTTFLKRQGSEKERLALSRDLIKMANEFEAGVARRSSGEQPRLFSSRTSR